MSSSRVIWWPTRPWIRTIGIFTIIIGLLVSGGYWFFYPQGSIVDYNASRDEAFIRKTIQDEWFWLIADNFNFSTDEMLATMSPPFPGAKHKGKLIIKVLLDNGKPQGFTSYFMDKFYQGRFQFLAVTSSARRKGYGKQLFTYAIQDMFNRGAEQIVLMTRLINPARKLYESAGFVPTEQNDPYINYKVTRATFKPLA